MEPVLRKKEQGTEGSRSTNNFALPCEGLQFPGSRIRGLDCRRADPVYDVVFTRFPPVSVGGRFLHVKSSGRSLGVPRGKTNTEPPTSRSSAAPCLKLSCSLPSQP